MQQMCMPRAMVVTLISVANMEAEDRVLYGGHL